MNGGTAISPWAIGHTWPVTVAVVALPAAAVTVHSSKDGRFISMPWWIRYVDGAVGGKPAGRHQPHAQTQRRGTGSRVLRYGGAGDENPGVRLPIGAVRPGEDAEVGHARLFRGGHVHPDPGQCFPAYGKEHPRQAAPSGTWGSLPAPGEVGRTQAQHGQERFRVEGLAQRGRRAGERRRARVLHHYRKQAGTALLDHLAGREEAATHRGDRGADARVAGERQLGLGGEDPGPIGRRRGRGREHENRLGEVELASQRVHLIAGQIGGSVDHGQRISRERAVGEHVDDLVRHGGHVRTLT